MENTQTTRLEKGQIWKSRRPLRWCEIRIISCTDHFVVYAYSDGEPKVDTAQDLTELLQNCEYSC